VDPKKSMTTTLLAFLFLQNSNLLFYLFVLIYRKRTPWQAKKWGAEKLVYAVRVEFCRSIVERPGRLYCEAQAMPLAHYAAIAHINKGARLFSTFCD
jgi:hypothetical protein